MSVEYCDNLGSWGEKTHGLIVLNQFWAWIRLKNIGLLTPDWLGKPFPLSNMEYCPADADNYGTIATRYFCPMAAGSHSPFQQFPAPSQLAHDLC